MERQPVTVPPIAAETTPALWEPSALWLFAFFVLVYIFVCVVDSYLRTLESEEYDQTMD